jgi:starch synthase
MKADILRAYPQIDSHKIAVIHNGIDLDAFQATSATETLEQLGINPSARSVVFVGRITQQKGLPYLLKAAKSLDPDVQLVLCAGAPDTVEIQNEVTALVEELKTLRSNVVWIERHLSRSELIAVLTSATVFACPSIYEPLGIVNLEAMACSVPVVATATGGIPEVVTHGVSGLLVEIEQVDDGSGKPLNEAQFVEDFAAALNAVLADPNIKAMGAAGRRRVEENFAWSRIAKDTIELYRDAIAAFQ